MQRQATRDSLKSIPIEKTLGLLNGLSAGKNIFQANNKALLIGELDHNLNIGLVYLIPKGGTKTNHYKKTTFLMS